MTTETKPDVQLPPDEGEAKNEAPERPTQGDACLGNKVVVIKRLGTRDGLRVGQTLLRYVSAIKEPIVAFTKGKDLDKLDEIDPAEATDALMEILEGLMAAMKEDDLLLLLSRLLGQPVDVVGDAPLDHTMEAAAIALSVNDVPALMRGAAKIWQEVQRLI